MDTPRIVWSIDEEIFDCDNVTEVIYKDYDGNLKVGSTVYYGELHEVDVKSLFHIDYLIETFGEQAWDKVGEAAEDYPNVTNEQVKELSDFIEGWLNKYAKPNFYTVENVKPYILTEQDIKDAE